MATVAMESGPDLAELLARVERGEAVALTRGGAVVARIEREPPAAGADPSSAREAKVEQLRRNRKSRMFGPISPEEVIAEERER